jgi:hypothetical protein
MITIIILHLLFGSTRDGSVNEKTSPSLPSPINEKKNRKEKKTHTRTLTASLKIIV